MTRDEILNMPAGREMDALVWMVINNQKPDLSMCRFVDGDYQPNAGYPAGHISPPRFSKSMVWAWDVFEGLSNNSQESLVGYDKEYGWRVSLWWFKGKGGIHELEFIGGETPAHAICRAALLAVMETE
jgi:hypothetical protein